MAKVIVGTDVGSYVFAPGHPGIGTITLVGFPALRLEQIVLVTDVTTGGIIYNFAAPATLGGSLAGGLAGQVLTLTAETSACASTDRLQIIVDLPASALAGVPPADDVVDVLIELLNVNKQQLAMLSAIAAEFGYAEDMTDTGLTAD